MSGKPEETGPIFYRRRLDFRLASHRALRRDVFLSDDFTCCECGWRPPLEDAARETYDGRFTVGVWDRYLHVDHIVPLVAGGSLTDPDNLQTLCGCCNSSKAGSIEVSS